MTYQTVKPGDYGILGPGPVWIEAEWRNRDVWLLASGVQIQLKSDNKKINPYAIPWEWGVASKGTELLSRALYLVAYPGKTRSVEEQHKKILYCLSNHSLRWKDLYLDVSFLIPRIPPIGCSLDNTLYECRDCDWISDSETEFKVHRKYHNVVTRFNGPPHYGFNGDRVIGRCYRCGMLFSDEGQWIEHDYDNHNQTTGRYADFGSMTSNCPDLDTIERLNYAREPIYVRRFKDSPGSPRGTSLDRSRFSRERKALKE